MSETYRINVGAYNAKNLGTDNADKIPHIHEIDIAHGLLTRDYKGLSDWNANVALEVIHLGKKEDIWKQEELVDYGTEKLNIKPEASGTV